MRALASILLFATLWACSADEPTRTATFVGTVRLPPHLQVLAISSDRLILLRRSALGVETLAVYGVEWVAGV